MMHHVDQRKLGMKTAHRVAMLANMASSLILSDRIETTLTRAKEVRKIADRIVTLCKSGTVHARRKALALIRNRRAVDQAFAHLGKRFADRNGGYTRIYRLGYRHGDAAPMAAIEYLKEVGASVSTPDTTVAKAKKEVRRSERAAEKAVKAEKKPVAKKSFFGRMGFKKD